MINAVTYKGDGFMKKVVKTGIGLATAGVILTGANAVANDGFN
jgi:hypothetical protein